MYSDHDTHRWVGCPIRISTDQSLLAAPHGFSQRATSFIASWCQGIHRMPLSRSIAPHAQKPATAKPRQSHANKTIRARTLRSIYTRASDRSPPRLQQRTRQTPPPPGQTNPRRGATQKRTNLFTCPKNTWIPDPMSPHRRLRASCRPKGARSDTPRDNATAPGGGGRDRTDDPLLAKQVLSQLSYAPKHPPNQDGGPGRT